MRLSIVTTMYRSASFIPEFHRRMTAAAQSITPDYELIFVNDGSPDNSLDLALSALRQDEHVRVIDLSRNFGHSKAIMTGLASARGDLVFLIDCDLEEDPELLIQFQVKLHESGAEVVFGVQNKRKGGWFERFSGGLFWKVLNALTDEEVPPNQITIRLMTQKFVSALIEHKDRSVYLPGLWALTGFKQVPLQVKKHSNQQTTYTLRKKIAQAVDSVTSFSRTPLTFIFHLGSLLVFLSSSVATYLIVKKLFLHDYQAGWASLIVSVWLLGGLTIFCIGVIGVYLSRIFLEVKIRPYTVINETHESLRNATLSLESSTAIVHSKTTRAVDDLNRPMSHASRA